MLTPEQIDDVVARVIGGDREAYRSLVETFEPRIRAVVAAIGPDRHFVQDLCQETFITAYLKLTRYKLGTNFGAWLSQIARNLARQEIRRRIREVKRVEDYCEGLKLQAAEANAAREHTHENVLSAALRECIKKLPEKHAKLVQSIYFQNAPPATVAEEFGRTLNWLRVMLHRIRKQLLVCIERTAET